MLSIAGCAKLATSYSSAEYKFGYSYRLCLSSGILASIVSIPLFACFIIDCRRKLDKNGLTSDQERANNQVCVIDEIQPCQRKDSGKRRVVREERRFHRVIEDKITGIMAVEDEVNIRMSMEVSTDKLGTNPSNLLTLEW